MLRRSIYIIGVVFLVGCKPGVPEEFIQPDDMEDILYDYFVSQGMATVPDKTQGPEDYRRDLYFNAVLKKHGITRAEFDSSMVYYYTRADQFVKVYKRVQDRLSEEALNLGASEGEVERYTTLTQNGDTANVWEGDRSMLLVPYAPYSHVQFSQKADTSYHKGDSFMMTFKSDFLYQSGSKDGLLYLALKYDNDSVASSVVRFSVSGNSQLRFNACDNRVKEISGYFYLGEGYEKSPDLKLLFLTNIQLVRFHKKKGEADKPAVPEEKPAQSDSSKMVPDSLRPRRHRLGERPMLLPGN